ncbi:MAG: cytochrome c family protein [Armatimonadota bacterium]
MKWLVPTLALSILGFGFAPSLQSQTANDVTIIISGGARGHLSPCGCTSPMSGGFKRLATLVRDLNSKGKVYWIDTGDIIDKPGRQSQMKAETYGELLGKLGVDAVAYTRQDQLQGAGLLAAAAPLTKRDWLAPNAEPGYHSKEQVTVGGLTVSSTSEQAAKIDIERPTDIVLFDGSKSALGSLKKAHRMEVFASEGIPTIDGSKVSPGSNLRGVLVATFRDHRLVSVRSALLESAMKEDAGSEKIYRNYLLRVTQEKLIEGVPKDSNADYSGSASCQSCHTKVYNQFLKTKHATAYRSLVKEGHQADPDCVACHVVGLNSTKGFWYEKTPGLAQVGCESCHGSGREHARNPKAFHLPKVEEKTCVTCHTPSNSPSFVFKSFWKKIKH